MKIAVAGTGYVGLSNALLLSQHNDVWAVDILQSKIDLINKGKSPIVDREIEEFLAREDLHLTATTDAEKAYKDADFVIIATPTNYDPKKNYFDTSSINKCRQKLKSYLNRAVELPADLAWRERDTSEDMDVRAAFYKLNDEERLILSSSLFGGYTGKEIAAMLEMNENTVRSLKSRALKKMEQMLSE